MINPAKIIILFNEVIKMDSLNIRRIAMNTYGMMPRIIMNRMGNPSMVEIILSPEIRPERALIKAVESKMNVIYI